MTRRFELLLFSVDSPMVRRCTAAGIDGLIVDWEHLDKERRQAAADTEINRHTLEDLTKVRAATSATVICRVNNGPTTREDVERAIAGGADEVLLPMVRGVREVEEVLEQAGDRCGVGILVETNDAVAAAEALGRLPLRRVYVGLNDLAIQRGTKNIFTSVADGTVEEVRAMFDVPFGFAGLTIPEGGRPIPCRLLMTEMARLGCSFSFLRRSFLRDLNGRDPRVEVPRIRAALEDAPLRTPEERTRDHADLCSAIHAWGSVRP